MKKIILISLVTAFCFAPLTMTAMANDAIDYYHDLMRKNEEERFSSYGDGDDDHSYDNPYDSSFKDEKVKAFKNPKKKSTLQLDTWGRNGGQTKSSESVLRGMMSPVD